MISVQVGHTGVGDCLCKLKGLGIMLADCGTLLVGVHFSHADAIADDVSRHSTAQRANKS